MQEPEVNKQKRRCPRLGHEVQFSYCRMPGSDMPCRKIFDCWWETFDIQSFMQEHYSPEILQEIAKPAQPKVASLLDLIQQARERTGRKEPPLPSPTD